jgi:hypothetical protein
MNVVNWGQSTTPVAPGPKATNPAGEYNRALAEEHLRAEFHRAYPGGFLGVTNGEQRARRPGTPPEFGPIDRGDFYAFAVPASAELYHVVPRFGRTLTQARLEDGGWGHIFDCQSWTPGRGTRPLAVLQPALFDCLGGRWTLKRRGILLAR